MSNTKLTIISRTCFILIFVCLILFILYERISPLGTTTTINSYSLENPLKLGPPNRITESTSTGETQTKLLTDLVYFTTDMQKNYNSALVKVTFQNNNENQLLQIGFQDQAIWHYKNIDIDIPYLNDLIKNGWQSKASSPSIFQKNNRYSSIDQLLQEPPENEIVGTINYNSNVFRQSYVPNYYPANKDTIIETPLRGPIIFYTYVSNEPFKLTIWKKDLNWYQDPDTVTVNIYKDMDIVYSAQIEDDGISDNSKQSLPPQQVYIQNPGPELPEPGVYKVVIDTGNDSFITKMQTNLHKIVFESPFFPISNKEVYPNAILKTDQNILFSNAKEISAITNHPEAVQQIFVGSESAQLNLREEWSTKSAEPITQITLPKSDVILQGKLGYFFFNSDQFFEPNRLNLQVITDRTDTEGVDYIIANYSPPKQEDSWKTAIINIDLKGAFVKNKKLSWIIRAPGLKENGNEVIIKSIEVELIKKPLINR